jgi:hypothetical protein
LKQPINDIEWSPKKELRLRRKLPEIKESIDELRDRLKGERQARIKQRLQMLYLLKTHRAHTILDVAQILAL